MITARIIFDSFDRPEVVIYHTGQDGYESPLAIIPAEKVKSWGKDVDRAIRDIKIVRKNKKRKKQ